jgi:hypothetical protein
MPAHISFRNDAGQAPHVPFIIGIGTAQRLGRTKAALSRPDNVLGLASHNGSAKRTMRHLVNPKRWKSGQVVVNQSPRAVVQS